VKATKKERQKCEWPDIESNFRRCGSKIYRDKTAGNTGKALRRKHAEEQQQREWREREHDK
jgi:hypothetical protein